MTAAELNQRFAIHDHLTFHDGSNGATHPGLTEIQITTPAAEATIYTEGAHLTRWTPNGQQPVIYLSPKSNFAPGKAIRGGIPVLFPWFGSGWDGRRKPMHGFARTSEWTVESTHLDSGPAGTGDIVVTLSLSSNDQSRAIAFPDFRAAIQFRIGAELSITLEITNHATEPFTFEEGLHNYFAIGNITQTTTEGLEGTTYLDKRDPTPDGNFTRKVQRDHLLRYTRDVDQVHVETTAPLTIHDAANHRDIHLHKQGSNTTVTWNPWSTLTPGLPDLPPDAWQHFVCVETVNAGDNRITLPPGHTHRMDSRISVTAA